MQYIKIFVMVSVVSCGLSSTSWGMEEQPDLKKGDEVTSFCPLAKSLPYMELLEFMQRQADSFFDSLIENFKKSDVVEIYRRDKASFSVDIREILVFDALVKVASLRNLANLAEYLIDTSKKMCGRSQSKEEKALICFESGLSMAIALGSDQVVALIIEKFYERYHFKLLAAFKQGITQIYLTDNCHLAKKLFNNARVVKALRSKDLIRAIFEEANSNSEISELVRRLMAQHLQ